MATTISIGKAIFDEDQPSGIMNEQSWLAFRRATREALVTWTRQRPYFEGEGLGWSETWGTEIAYTYVGADVLFTQDYEALRKDLAYICGTFNQDAIALTSTWTDGKTEFVSFS